MPTTAEQDITQWLKLECSLWDPTQGCALFLDLRPEDDFRAQRFEHSVNLPFNILKPSLYLLPPRTRPFAVVLDSRLSAQEQLSVLCADFKGHSWTVTGAFVGGDDLFTTCSKLQDERVTVQSGVVSFHSVKRLWEPSSALERWLPRCEPPIMDKCIFDDAIDRAERYARAPVCLDLGSGVGRDAVWVARRGWRVVALDCDQKGLDRCARLATQEGVAGMVSCVRVDLGGSDNTTCEELLQLALGSLGLQLGQVAAVYAVRFLQKPLLHTLTRLLSPGATLLWFHFMRGCEISTVGRPSRDKDLLEYGELRNAVCSSVHTPSITEPRCCKWDVLVDDVLSLPDGRPISEFVAVRNII